jgi:putative peptidoglycan lipid II flippase
VAIAVFAAGALFALAGPAVTAVYERGRFSAEDSLAVATLLSILIFACPAWVAQQIASRAFYARGDTWRPMLLSSAVALGMIPAYLALGRGFGASGIAAAGAIGMAANAVAIVVLARRLHGAPRLAPLATTLARAVAIAALAALPASRAAFGLPGTTGALLDLALGGAVFVCVVGLGVAWLGDEPMRDEAKLVLRRLRRRRAPA